MNYFLRYKYWVLLSTLLWLMASWVGAHGHFCFDGIEPPVSIHLDSIDTHESHDTSSSHVDMDVDLSPSVIVKLLKFDVWLPLLLAAVIVFLVAPQGSFFLFHSQSYHPRRVVGIRPPLRAPPATPF